MTVQDHLDCCSVPRCRDGGCEYVLPESKCISGSKYQENHHHVAPLADCIAFAARDVQVVELKTGHPSASEVLAQLQGGARVAEQLAPPNADLSAILAHRGISAIEYKVLRARYVSFRGKKIPIELKRCV